MKGNALRQFRIGLLACGLLAGAAISASAVQTPVEFPPHEAPADTQPPLEVPNDLRWEPAWREKGDCGPLALFVLLQLQGQGVALDQVRSLIPLDPEMGCSLKDLHTAAEKLGLATETRFVEPRDLAHLPGPFIMHGVWSIEKNRGHFYLILGYDAKTAKFAVIDTVMARLGWMPADTVQHGYSGYVLIPKSPVGRTWERWTSYLVLILGTAMLAIWSHGKYRQIQHHRT